MLLLVDQLLQMVYYLFSIDSGIPNAVGRILQLHFHFVNYLFFDTRNLIRKQVVQVLVPPMLVVKQLHWVFHNRNNMS